MKVIWDEKARVATVREKEFVRSPDRVLTWTSVYMRHVTAEWDKRSGILGVFCNVIRRYLGSEHEEEISHEFAPVLKICDTREAAIRRVLREIDRWMEEMFAEKIIPSDDDRTDEQVMEEYYAVVEGA